MAPGYAGTIQCGAERITAAVLVRRLLATCKGSAATGLLVTGACHTHGHDYAENHRTVPLRFGRQNEQVGP